MPRTLSILLSFTILTSLFGVRGSLGQVNLVNNWSFENYSVCPDNTNQIDRATGWTSYRNSPDYFNSCACPSCFVSIPNNFAGEQVPAEGNAYSGFVAYYKGLLNAREYIGTQLSSSLEIGESYYVSFKISLAAGVGYNCSTNKIGIKFSTQPYSVATPQGIDNSAHIYTDSIVNDTLNWVELTGSFVADSAYQYISIGNFFDDNNTDTASVYPWFGICTGYYYVDEVWVSLDSTNSIKGKHQSTSCWRIWPTPASDYISISRLGYSDSNEVLFNLYTYTGCLVKTGRLSPNSNIDLKELANGSYIMTLTENNQHSFYPILIIK